VKSFVVKVIARRETEIERSLLNQLSERFDEVEVSEPLSNA
jgi:hypothetical protein